MLLFAVQLADFGLAHASRDGSIIFEPVNTDIRGTPGLDTKEQQLLLSRKLSKKLIEKTKTVKSEFQAT